MAERSNAAVLKTVEVKASGGSNPSLSASQGAKEGKTFVDYVNYLNDKNYIPPKSRDWVDAIRKLGNEANHSIEFKSPEDARLILTFTEMLLKFIYEMPGLLGGGERT